MTCRHKKSFPTVYYGKAGYEWCPDCGATRQITVNGISYTYSDKKWLYPKGAESVLKQMEKLK